MSTGLSCQTGAIFRLAHTIEAASNRGNALMSLSRQNNPPQPDWVAKYLLRDWI